VPPSYAGFGVGGMDYHEAGSRASQPVWMVWPSARAVSSVAFVGPRSADGDIASQRAPLRQRMRAALQLLFDPANTAGG
jgi:hypothetical protein